jgi:hypothetical protein
VRRLVKEPREEARLQVDRLRQSLIAEFLLLQSFLQAHQLQADSVENIEDNPSSFDDLDDVLSDTGSDIIPEDPRPSHIQESDLLPPERRVVILPSTHMPHDQALRKAELALRIKQATRYLAAIREAIVQKSFQFAQIMRAAPSKGVRTRTRTTIAKLNERIALCCRVYGRARAAMVRLAPDHKILDKFRTLSKEDVKASTAIVDPNDTGSTSLRLSWIWQTRTLGAGSNLDAMRECEYRILIAD